MNFTICNANASLFISDRKLLLNRHAKIVLENSEDKRFMRQGFNNPQVRWWVESILGIRCWVLGVDVSITLTLGGGLKVGYGLLYNPRLEVSITLTLGGGLKVGSSAISTCLTQVSITLTLGGGLKAAKIKLIFA